MDQEQLTSTITIDTTPDAVFAVLADPTTHASIEGTGWVRKPVDTDTLTTAGQVFRMGMYHPNHPNKDYEIANRVEVLEPSRTIAWKPGSENADGGLEFGGWMWRYDLDAAGATQTDVTLTYDWSGATPEARQAFQFPMFGEDYLTQSLQHLATLATATG